MKKDYFGLYDPTSAGHMGYNWRQTVWYPGDKTVYGVHGNSGYLFRFDPRAQRVAVIDRLAVRALKTQRDGSTRLAIAISVLLLGLIKHTLYYLTGGPVYVDGHRVKGKSSTAMGEAKGLEDLHLITYDIAAGKYKDHGAIFYGNGQRPLYVNAIAVAKDGTVYTLVWPRRMAGRGPTCADPT